MKDYECHVTVSATTTNMELESVGSLHGWKTSFIEGDPDMGKGSRFFFTKHHEYLAEAFEQTEKLTKLLVKLDVCILRKKIEEVLMDTRNGTWRLK